MRSLISFDRGYVFFPWVLSAFVDSFLSMIALLILNGVSPGSSRAGREIKAKTRVGR